MFDKQGKVSLFIGNFDTSEELNKFMEEIYNDDDEVSSDFMNLFKIEFIDSQFQEIDFYEKLSTKKEIFDGFSYIESFINDIPEIDWNTKNSIILLYNFEYNGTEKGNEKIEFINVFDYLED